MTNAIEQDATELLRTLIRNACVNEEAGAAMAWLTLG